MGHCQWVAQSLTGSSLKFPIDLMTQTLLWYVTGITALKSARSAKLMTKSFACTTENRHDLTHKQHKHIWLPNSLFSWAVERCQQQKVTEPIYSACSLPCSKHDSGVEPFKFSYPVLMYKYKKLWNNTDISASNRFVWEGLVSRKKWAFRCLNSMW